MAANVSDFELPNLSNLNRSVILVNLRYWSVVGVDFESIDSRNDSPSLSKVFSGATSSNLVIHRPGSCENAVSVWSLARVHTPGNLLWRIRRRSIINLEGKVATSTMKFLEH